MTISNIIEPKTLETILSNLVSEREAWEAGSYLKSNQELYALLEKCLNQYTQVKHSASLRNVVSQMLRERNIAFNASTNTLTKIVRLVFGDCGKRAYTYARVIQVALAEKPENVSLATFITNAGGVEEIRRRNVNGISPTQLRQKRIAAAENYFVRADGIITVETVESITPNVETENNLSLAILRLNADGTSTVVCGIENIALLNAALEHTAKKQKMLNDPKAEVSRELELQALRADAIKDVLGA